MRQIKSDHPDEVGQHCFERAGLGCAPFTVTGFGILPFQAAPDAPVQPGGTCDYCGTAILYVCYIRAADGRAFGVGCDCVNRTGDAGLITAYKQSLGYRAHQKALRQAKDDANRAEIERILGDETLTDRIDGPTLPTPRLRIYPVLREAQ